MVRSKYLEVHETGDTFTDVTEGTFVVGRFWERNRYDWSDPVVTATVTESNVLKPGSTWEVRAMPGTGAARSR